MQIPQSDILSTNAMNRVFDTTTATYKFYWLLALLDMHVKEQKDEMRALDVAARGRSYARNEVCQYVQPWHQTCT